MKATTLAPRQPRLHDEGYLAWLRTRYCLTCGKPPPCDPAHIRELSRDNGKPLTGMGRKPDDKWALPLCRSCHASQHAAGNESAWWGERGLDPFNLALDYYAQYGGEGGEPKKQKRKTRKPRTTIKPKGFGKIPSRPFPQGRKFNR